MSTNLFLCTLILIHLFIKSALTLYAPLDVYGELPVDSHTSSVPQQKCQPVETPFCDIDKYMTVQPFNNSFGHTSLKEAIAELHKYGYLFQRPDCRDKIQLFLCSLYAPVCATPLTILDKLLLPCRDDCEEAKRVCLPILIEMNEVWHPGWDCEKFHYHRDDKLCVIDNGKESSNYSRSAHPPQQPIFPTASSSYSTSTSTENACAEDLFDCRLRDPTTKMSAFCIDKSLVCDGKKDCLINGTEDGLDEADCELRCADGQLSCDGKCINKIDICNGKVDCSSGVDEQDCYDYVTGLAQSILCIFALFSAIFLLVKFFKIDDQTSEQDSVEIPSEDVNIKPNSSQTFCQPMLDPLPHTLDDEGIVQNMLKPDNAMCRPDIRTNVFPVNNEMIIRHLYSRSNSTRCPIYQEPTYSVSTKSDYELLNTGGYSGESSVYMLSGDIEVLDHHYAPSSNLDTSEIEPNNGPPGPPPSPIPEFDDRIDFMRYSD